MKRKDLIKKLEYKGCVFLRHGANHDWYQNPFTGICQSVPRHGEINERLAKHILKIMSND